MSDGNQQPAATLPRPADAARGQRHRRLGNASWLSGRGLLGQIGSVVADVPLFVTAPLYRRWHLRWGSTSDEIASAMPGDAMLPDAQFVSTSLRISQLELHGRGSGRTVGVGDDTVTPQVDLVAKDPKLAEPSRPDHASRNDTPAFSVIVGHGCVISIT